eukprot:12008603-Prorocentrum_lima.AAC.1
MFLVTALEDDLARHQRLTNPLNGHKKLTAEVSEGMPTRDSEQLSGTPYAVRASGCVGNGVWRPAKKDEPKK